MSNKKNFALVVQTKAGRCNKIVLHTSSEKGSAIHIALNFSWQLLYHKINSVKEINLRNIF